MTLAQVTASSLKSAGASGSGILTQTVTPTVTTGNRINVYTTHFDDSASPVDVNTPTDSQSNTYTKCKTNSIATQGGLLSVSCWSAVMNNTGSNTITVTCPGTGTANGRMTISCQEFSGEDMSSGVSWIDVSATATGQNQTTLNCSSGTTPATTANGQIAISHVGDTGAGDIWAVFSGGFSRDTNASVDFSAINSMAIGTKASSSGSAEVCVWTNGNVIDSDCAYVIVMKAAGAATFLAKPSPRINQAVRRSTYY